MSSQTVLARRAITAMALLGACLAAAPAHTSGTRGGVPYYSVDSYLDDPVDIIIFGKTYRVYGSVTIVFDPPAQQVTSFGFSLRYNPAIYAFDPSMSGPLGAFSVGGDNPPPTPGVGTQPVQVLPTTGFNPGSPLPGSTLAYTNSGGLLTMNYVLGSPVTVTGDVNNFRIDFTVLNPLPFDFAASTVTYDATGPGSTFTQVSAACTTVDMSGDCFSDTPATGISYDFVPEPATWATILLGLGLIGSAARTRRSRPPTYS